jgi:hypothetical protein
MVLQAPVGGGGGGGGGRTGVDTAIKVFPACVVSCVETAVIEAVPEAKGVKTPEDVIEPSVANQVTPLPKLPVPVTLAEQADVCVVKIELGLQTATTPVIVDVGGGGGGGVTCVLSNVTVTKAVPYLLEFCVDVALITAVPGENKPPVAVPCVTLHWTAVLKVPVPFTVAVQDAVWVRRILVGVQVTLTEVMEEACAKPHNAKTKTSFPMFTKLRIYAPKQDLSR